MQIDSPGEEQDVRAEAIMTELELRRALDSERYARLEAERLLAEKDDLIARNDVLMREVDHRVKNSLQLVASVLSLQARRLPKGPAVDAIENARERVLGIAAVHEQLYRASDFESVDMRVFLEGLCEAIAANKPDNILAVEIGVESVMLGSKRAAKIGLLIVELVTNAFKHAYPAGDKGNVRVALKANDDSLELTVSDDGVGLADPGALEATLGLRIVRSITSQIGGTLSTLSNPGICFMLVLPRD